MTGAPSNPRPLTLTDAGSVREALLAGAAANRAAACRRGSVDRIAAPARLIATGDLHDNPAHLARLIQVAAMGEADPDGGDGPHLTLHEIIHSDRLIGGMDLSYRALTRVAALKARFPERVHTLLGNHELAQITGAGIIKDGVRSVDAFNAGVGHVFGSDADAVDAAIGAFVRSMPLALRASTPRGDILCAHSLPPAAIMARFDATVLSRDLTEADYEPRTGAAHLMTWGRGYDAELLEDLVERWGVYLFILGHERADEGVKFVPPNAVILASDHARGVYLPLDLADPPSPHRVARLVVPLAEQG